ncbi:hypothetical protein PM082_014016 [Marasmius tenuissimus]|nr:hypothetical protein PM082_014016 [Marasmius tenuissimus]
MESEGSTRPKQLQNRLSAFAIATVANGIANDRPLLELAEDACSRMVLLMEDDPAHTANEKRYRDFYFIVQDIIKHFEKNISTDAQRSPPKPIRLRKFVLFKLRRKLEREFKKAVGPHKSSLCRWEDVLVLIGVVASNISAVPVLAPLQPVGSVLEQIGELVKTVRTNNKECAELICRATNILAELSRAMQMCPDLELLDGIKRDIVAFERALIHIRDYVSQLQRESRLKTLGRVVFASKTKEDLEDLRKELECAQMVFMTSNICAIRVGVHAIAVQTATDGDELPPAQGGKVNTHQIWQCLFFFKT